MPRCLIWLCLTVLALSAPASAAKEKSTFHNSHPTYRALRDAGLSGRSAPVDNLALEREGARFTFESGTIHLVAPVDERITGAVFLGKGNVQILPATAGEQLHLRFLTRSEAYADEFERLVLRFTDSTAAELADKLDFQDGPPNAEADGLLKRARKKLVEKRHYDRPNVAAGFVPYNLDGRLLLDLLREVDEGLFHAWIPAKKHGEVVWIVDPLGAPFVAPEEVVLVGLESENLGVWVASHQKAHLSGDASNELHGLVDLESHQIDATTAGDRLDARSTVSFTALQPAVQALAFDLHPHLRVDKVTDGEGRELHFVQEDKDEDGDFFVVLHEPLAAGATGRLTVEYSGEKALDDSGGGNFTLVARTNWYPNSHFGDRADYDITLRSKKGLEMVATGKLVEEREEDKLRVTRWQSDVPLAVAGFNFGRFKSKTEQDSELDYTIETYANRELPDYLRGLLHRLEQVGAKTNLGSLSTTGMMDKARAEAQTSLRLFTHYFGPLPYGRLAMTQQPAPNFGQAWPMLVYMPLTAFLDSTHRHELLRDFGSSFFKYVAAHEVAHQWWGHVIGWKSYRDQWMSEGFSEFSASLFAQTVYGNEKFREFWREQREQILTKNTKGARPVEVGPISMGYRLDTAKTGYVTRRMIYPKGAYVLHMMRMLMWSPQQGDGPFIAMMQDFVRSHFNQDVSSRDFQAVLERHVTPDMDLEGNGRMDWFFRQWVDGTTVPRYRLDYQLQPEGAGTRLVGKVTQSEVDESFMMRVPIYVAFAGKDPVRLGSLALYGNSSGDFEVLLPQRPDKVLLCWFEDVLRKDD